MDACLAAPVLSRGQGLGDGGRVRVCMVTEACREVAQDEHLRSCQTILFLLTLAIVFLFLAQVSHLGSRSVGRNGRPQLQVLTERSGYGQRNLGPE